MNTKLIISLLGLLLASTTLSAQTSVWKITKDRRSIYLAGTCPLLRPTDYPVPKEFDQAFTAAPQVIFETDMVRLQSPEIQQTMANRSNFTDGKSIDQIIGPDSWRQIQEICGMAGIPEDNMSKAQGWRCRAMLKSIETQKLSIAPKTLDTYFFQRTLGTQKVVESLDTVEQHVDYQTKVGVGREKELIELSLQEISSLPATQEAVVNAWKVGDLTKLDEVLLKNLRQDHPALYRELFAQRSLSWLPKIEAMFQTSKPKFVLVGVGHLAGPEGLIAQLKQRGYTIEQVKSADKK